MIKKERSVPLQIKKLEALLRRLPTNHLKRQEVVDELTSRQSGYRGELSLNYYLSFLHDQKFNIFNDLRLQFNEYFFQLDTLLVSPTHIIILELKNNSGTIIFDPTCDQVFRESNEEKIAIKNPVLQVNHQQLQFQRWLKLNHFENIPVESLVVYTNPKVMIQLLNNDPSYKKKIIRSPSFLTKIENINKLYKNEALSLKELRKLSNLLIRKHTPLQTDILNQFAIEKNEVMTGVHCPSCSALPMNWKWGRWCCTTCSFTSKDAHLDALNDYALLIASIITNQQCRDFLHIPSTSISNKLLHAMKLKQSGINRWRRYQLEINLH